MNIYRFSQKGSKNYVRITWGKASSDCRNYEFLDLGVLPWLTTNPL